MNNTAKIMFGKEPRIEIQMAIFATTEKLTFNDINRAEGRILDLVDIGERYIRNAMRYRVIIDGTQISRKEIPEVPHIAIREALLNSFCHKNYRTPQNNEIAIFSDRIEIYNPGTFPIGITPDEYIKGEGHPIHRNPLLAQIMYYSKDIERFGTGLKRIADACEEADVRYEFVSDYYGFTVVFYRPPLWTSDRIEENMKITGQDTRQDTGQDSRFNALINFCALPRSRREMQNFIDIASREHFLNAFLKPLLESGDLRMTIPNKPNSKNQKYVVNSR